MNSPPFEMPHSQAVQVDSVSIRILASIFEGPGLGPRMRVSPAAARLAASERSGAYSAVILAVRTTSP